MDIKQISKEKAAAIVANGNDRLEGYEPWGLFFTVDKNQDGITVYTGIDNNDGHCWMEEFYSIGTCMAWLRGENYD